MEDCSESDLSNYMPRKKDLLRGVIDDLERLSEKKLELQKPVQTRANQFGQFDKSEDSDFSDQTYKRLRTANLNFQQ